MSSSPIAARCPACDSDAARAERMLAGYPLVRCLRCALVYVWPRPGREASAASYAAGRRGAMAEDAVLATHAAELFDAYAAEDTPYRREARRQLLVELHGMRPVQRLLDFGCGSGHWLDVARATLGCETYGIEVNPVATVGARAFGFTLHAGTLETCPFAPASFDLILCAQVLEHLPEPRLELARLAALLAPGGLLFVEVPHYGSLSIRLGRDSFRSNIPPGHLNYFTRRPLARLLERCGLVPVRIRTTGLPHRELLEGGPPDSDRAPSPPEDDRRATSGRSRTEARPGADEHLAARIGTEVPGAAMRARLGLLRGLDEVLSLPGWGKQLAIVARRTAGRGGS